MRRLKIGDRIRLSMDGSIWEINAKGHRSETFTARYLAGYSKYNVGKSPTILIYITDLEDGFCELVENNFTKFIREIKDEKE